MALTKQESLAKARTAKAAKLEAAADTSAPEPRDLQAEAQAGHDAATGIDPTSYVYVGGLAAVVVVVDGSSYDFRKNEPVHLAHPVAGLDEHPDFDRWEG